MQIVAKYSAPIQGAIVDKIGRTTGWTYGEVYWTCADFGVEYRSHSRLRCQYVANYGNYYGDSGSPVFFWHGDSVSMVGIHWGIKDEDPSFAAFSSWSGIEKDLGTVYVVENGVE